jgi:hypothetical protein
MVPAAKAGSKSYEIYHLGIGKGERDNKLNSLACGFYLPIHESGILITGRVQQSRSELLDNKKVELSLFTGNRRRPISDSLTLTIINMKKQDSGSHPPTRKPGGRNPLRFAPLALILVLLWNATLISQAVDGSIRHCFNLKGILRRPNILIRSNSTLQWVACPDNSTFYCSFFSVPLDYSTPSDEDKTVIAMRMYPSTAPKTARLGSIFTNPGVGSLEIHVIRSILLNIFCSGSGRFWSRQPVKNWPLIERHI